LVGLQVQFNSFPYQVALANQFKLSSATASVCVVVGVISFFMVFDINTFFKNKKNMILAIR